ncbi:hypothetical protein NE237_012116 [Protea cynaroides]|uniref:Uncharacterized protein n=1 Tax=Protea cynaroides TaxID=273540 RepID=A0A9Q0GWX1_9MAGN|nr:hypothetical protein NE237_012116 [Protea cynaroides]
MQWKMTGVCLEILIGCCAVLTSLATTMVPMVIAGGDTLPQVTEYFRDGRESSVNISKSVRVLHEWDIVEGGSTTFVVRIGDLIMPALNLQRHVEEQGLGFPDRTAKIMESGQGTRSGERKEAGRRLKESSMTAVPTSLASMLPGGLSLSVARLPSGSRGFLSESLASRDGTGVTGGGQDQVLRLDDAL